MTLKEKIEHLEKCYKKESAETETFEYTVTVQMKELFIDIKWIKSNITRTLKSIQKKLKLEKIESKLNKKDGESRVVCVRKKHLLSKLFNYLYKDASIWMPRKKEIFNIGFDNGFKGISFSKKNIKISSTNEILQLEY